MPDEQVPQLNRDVRAALKPAMFQGKSTRLTRSSLMTAASPGAPISGTTRAGASLETARSKTANSCGRSGEMDR